MRKFRHIIAFLIFISSPAFLNAQSNEVIAGLRAGHNAVFGGFAAAAIETAQTLFNDFSLNGGIQYNTIGKTSLEIRPAYEWQFDWGKLRAEALATYSHLISISNFAAGAGTHFDFNCITARIGYYYRLYGGQSSKISEPFNVYYEFCVHFLRKLEKWLLDLKITNCEIFELERHYQPSYIAETAYFPTSKMGICIGIGCKPSGPFNMSADYYQSFIKTGICYRW